MQTVLAIDPGTTQSGWCLIDVGTKRPLQFDKQDNELVLQRIAKCRGACVVAVERIVPFGRVGKEVSETCEWVGRFVQKATEQGLPYAYVLRREEKKYICGGNPKANDTMMRHNLIEMFAQHDFKTGKGTLRNPDWFHGFRADVWQAYAVGITYLMKREKENEHDRP